MPIRFFSQQARFSLRKKAAAAKLIRIVIRKEKKKEGEISFIFCSDAFLHTLNKKFLKHDTLTDIITFGRTPDARRRKPSSVVDRQALNGEIYISIPRVKENAKKFGVAFGNELSRVMIHGVLHLCGYNDKLAAEKKKMRRQEDYYLSQ